jgi:hypothetical protein
MNFFRLHTVLSLLLLAIAISACTSGSLTGEAKRTIAVQCSDHLDNDGDGYCDFAARGAYCSDGSTLGDPGCNTKSDDTELATCVPKTEVCDGADNDCDAQIDEGDVCTVSYYCDQDADGVLSSKVSGTCTGVGCQPASCQTKAGLDCADADATIRPGAAEVCNSKDDDCDLQVDEGFVCGMSGPCKEVYPGTNDPAADRINIIFVGHNFASTNDILTYAKRGVDRNSEFANTRGLLELAVYKDNPDKFNIWYVDQMFTTGTISSCTQCYNSASSSYCGGLANSYRINVCNNDFRGCAYFGGQSYLSTVWGNYEFVVDHEFQHQFPRLADEYTEGTSDRPSSPNCAPDLATAQSWWGQYAGQSSPNDGMVVGYNDGCAYVAGNYRPTANSIMRTHGETRLGLVNEQHVVKALSAFTGAPTAPQTALAVTIEGDPADASTYQVTGVQMVEYTSPVKERPGKYRLKASGGRSVLAQNFDTEEVLIEEDLQSAAKVTVEPQRRIVVMIPAGKARLDTEGKLVELPGQASVPFDLVIEQDGKVLKRIAHDEFKDKTR